MEELGEDCRWNDQSTEWKRDGGKGKATPELRRLGNGFFKDFPRGRSKGEGKHASADTEVGPVDKTDSPFTGLDTGRVTQSFGIPHRAQKRTFRHCASVQEDPANDHVRGTRYQKSRL